MSRLWAGRVPAGWHALRLSELPDRLETQEWVELDGPALAAYQEAVFAGNFMAMRRAAFAPDAIDVSDLPAAKEVASQAEAQRRIVETEQKRLRAAAEPRELTLRLRRAGGHLGQCR